MRIESRQPTTTAAMAGRSASRSAFRSAFGSIAAALTAVALLVLAGAAQALDFTLREIVHQEKSMYRNVLILEGDGRRCMTFGRRHALQTCILISRPDQLIMPYTRGVFAGLLAKPEAKRVLVIGLGGGVIPSGLRRIDPTMHIDAVELDPAVAKAARERFFFREDARMRVFVDDGRVFVRRQLRAGARYDLIIVDACERNYLPEHMITQEFMRQLKTLLNPNGIVAANTFSRGKLTLHEAATYQSVFGETRLVDVPGMNRIILAGRDGLPSIRTMRDNAHPFQAKFASIGVSTDEILDELRPHPRADGVRPLTDQYSPANLLFFQ
jgi:spermidine synthase